MVLVTSGGRPPTVSARPRDTPSGRGKRNKGHGPRNNAGAKRRTGNTTRDGGLVGAMFQRQATGRRGRGCGLGPRDILSARGEFKKRVRREFEGVPEMVVEVRKALASDNTGALFIAVRAILAKLVEGNSAPFDLPPRPEASSASSSSARNGAHSHAHGHGGGGEEAAGGDVHHHGTGGGAGHRHGDDDDDDPYHNGYPRVRRVDRDVFVALGGPELLIEVLRRPQWPADARRIPADVVSRDIPVWNMTLYTLRELCYTDQDLSERLGSSELILYLLTMMGHTGVFDNAVGLVEEILAVKSNTYFLGEVPDLHSLFDNMSSQQLAHFSRVLALLVFEPEYRQLMESAHVLRSMELLQLRRDRVVRADSVIDKNQALVLSAPNLLPRLMELLRVMNYNPPLAAFEEHPMDMPDHFAAQIRIGVVGSEMESVDRRGLQQQAVASEWAYLAELRAAAGADARTAGAASLRSAEEASRQDSRRSTGNVGEPSRIVNFFRSLFRRNNSLRSDADINSARRSRDSAGATGPLTGDAGDSIAVAGTMGMVADGVGVDGLANFAVRDLMNFLNPAFTAPNAEAVVARDRTLASSIGGVMTGSIGVGTGRVRSRRRLQQPSAADAREELQLNGLLLAPHQVEVLFVLCTLLGARRKGEAHEALAKLGLIEVLDSMFDRLSWGVPSRQEGPHGAHCDCNPESALRVQYLRLVHNFLDRDSNNNPLKRLLLSTHERQLFASGRFMANPNGSGNVVFVKSDASESDAPQPPFVWRGRAESGIPAESEAEKAKWVDTRGLLSKIVDVFMKEPMDSLYRFWLASCVEAFLRGGTTQEQLFIAGGGLLGHLVKEITSDGVWCTGSLQTAFDLLGELCKGNREVLEMLEASMTEKQLRRFLEVMVDNLVDSNVFMRSLVLSVEHSAFRRQTTAMSSGWQTAAPRIREDNVAAARGATVVSSRDAPGVAKGVRYSVADGDRHGASGSDTVDCNGEDGADEGEFYAKDGEGFQGLGAGEEPCYLGHTWFDVETQDVSLDSDSDTDEEEDWFSAKDTREEGCTGSEDGDSSPSSTAAAEVEEIEKRGTGKVSLKAARCTEHDGFSDSDESGTTNGGGGGRASERRQQRQGTATGLAGTEESKGGEENAIVSEVRGTERPGAAASGRRVMWGAGDGVAGFTRLQVFLKHNTPQLVRDLMGVVNLETINHENICCLNTAVLILIFADRRGQLAELVREVRRLPAGRKVPDVERDDDESKENEDDGTSDIDSGSLFGAYSRERRRHANQRQSRNAEDHGEAGAGIDGDNEEPTAPADGNTVLLGFRRLLWFWGEYYMRGGRDRLSLEFSTHVKFWAWKRVIRLLCADDGSPTALVAAPLRLPRSRYDTILPPPSTPGVPV